MRLPVLVCLLVSYIHTVCQTYPVKAGLSPDAAIPSEAKYFLPEFAGGAAFLRNGAVSKHLFNYNRLLDEMQFLTPTGDTLTIAEPGLVKYIQIDSVIFYHEKGYLREIEKSGYHTLAIRERLIQVSDKVEGAYGASSGTSSVTTYANIHTSGAIYKLNVKRNVSFAKAQAFFIGDRYNHFSRADKKGFAEAFPDKKEIIGEYIRKEKINFHNPDDIKKLFHLCALQEKAYP
ncbi:MAG: hypothetical protein KF746_26595 [Chitinophagaceae bacterium]|nr:hypothetical protein [Chitinophagaceae bacterium]